MFLLRCTLSVFPAALVFALVRLTGADLIVAGLVGIIFWAVVALWK